MDSLNVEDLVIRAKVGEVSGPELEAAANALERGAGKDTYQLLYVLGRTDSRKHERLIASFLDFEQDAQVAALALSILCSQWGLGERYREHLHGFLLGEDWDFIDEVKQAAISSAGEYLRSTSDCSILGTLFAIATSAPGDLNERFAVEALARSLGEPHSSAVFPAGADAKFWGEDILTRARQRLEAECG